MEIHPTAIINSAAEISDGVKIGPYVCIDGRAIIGPGCILHAHAVLMGTVSMGRDNIIGYGAVIGGEPQDHAFNSKVRSKVIIGNNNNIREHCTTHDSATTVGDNNYFMVGSHLAHNTVVGNHVVMANNALLAGHVEVQDHAYIGGGDVFHQHVRVGQFAFTRGKSGFAKDIPPFTLAANLNAIIGVNMAGLLRAGFSVEERSEIKAAFKLLYKSGLNTTQAIERARHMQWSHGGRIFFDFVASAKKRGICDVRKG